MEGDGLVRSVVEQQQHGEMLSASNAELWREQPGHDVEIVRRVEAPVERPSFAQLDREAGSIFRLAVSAPRCECDRRWANSVHDVTDNRAAHQRLGEYKRQQLLVIMQVVRRESLCGIVAILRAMERQL